MYESHSKSTSSFLTLLGRAEAIAASIKLMNDPKDFGSQKMCELQTELSKILAELAPTGPGGTKNSSGNMAAPLDATTGLPLTQANHS